MLIALVVMMVVFFLGLAALCTLLLVREALGPDALGLSGAAWNTHLPGPPVNPIPIHTPIPFPSPISLSTAPRATLPSIPLDVRPTQILPARHALFDLSRTELWQAPARVTFSPALEQAYVPPAPRRRLNETELSELTEFTDFAECTEYTEYTEVDDRFHRVA